MNDRMTWTGAAILAAVLAGGCASDEKNEHVPMTAIPGTVLAGVDKAFPGSTVKSVDKESYPDGTVHWEVEIVNAKGKKMNAEFNNAGELLESHTVETKSAGY